MAMNKLIAIGLACCLPTGLAAEDPRESEVPLGTVNVLVIEESLPIARDVLCARGAPDKPAECMATHRAVLTARMQKVSTLRERGRWM
jgi:hypothetical protein